ncbi:MAG: tRNA (adenosine(37)-N6)-threonylcarbamoyltransferase complex dimerization subunit type 1 TsaB [Candidatus Omnitrophota bacterium]
MSTIAAKAVGPRTTPGVFNRTPVGWLVAQRCIRFPPGVFAQVPLGFPFRRFLNTIPLIMNLLAMETSGPVLSVAIKKSGAKLRHATVEGYMKHAENLLPVINRLLQKEKLKIRDIDAFLIGRGPGSFTGLRIGFATLKGFLATRPRPCYGALSLDLIAAGMRPERHTNLTVCLDARRGKLYARSYRYRGKRWNSCGPSRVLPIDPMVSGLSRGSWIAGDGVKKFDSSRFVVAPEKSWHSKASTLIALFETKNPLLKKLLDPKEFLPVYLRNSEAEERLKDKRHV